MKNIILVGGFVVVIAASCLVAFNLISIGYERNMQRICVETKVQAEANVNNRAYFVHKDLQVECMARGVHINAPYTPSF